MSRRGGLGRGLDALLPPTQDGGLERRGAAVTAPIDRIVPNPRQPRRAFDEAELAELTHSVTELGILQPLLVRETAAGYELIAGERRLRAATAAGLSEVPVLVVETDERGSLERALVENIHRADLNPIEEAAAYKELMDEGGLTQEALGAKLGRSRVTVTNALRLLDLPLEVQGLLTAGRLTAGHGRALLGLQGNPLQPRLARRAAPTYEKLKEILAGSPVVYPDETGWRIGGRSAWLWVFTNQRQTAADPSNSVRRAFTLSTAPADAGSTSGRYTPLTPTRILDTRSGLGTNGAVAPLQADQAIDVYKGWLEIDTFEGLLVEYAKRKGARR